MALKLTGKRQFLACPRSILQFVRFASKKESPVPDGKNLEKTINSVNLLGRVGSDPARRGTDMHPVVIFSLATHTNYKYETGETTQKTDWHRICVFKPGLRDSVFNYLKKGQRIHVNGRISYGQITEDGVSKPATSIIAEDIIFFNSGESYS